MSCKLRFHSSSRILSSLDVADPIRNVSGRPSGCSAVAIAVTIDEAELVEERARERRVVGHPRPHAGFVAGHTRWHDLRRRRRLALERYADFGRHVECRQDRAPQRDFSGACPPTSRIAHVEERVEAEPGFGGTMQRDALLGVVRQQPIRCVEHAGGVIARHVEIIELAAVEREDLAILTPR